MPVRLRQALPLRQEQPRSATLPRCCLPGEANVLFLQYFYTLHGRKKETTFHQHREIPGQRNSPAHHPRCPGLPEFAGMGVKSCGCTMSLFLRKTLFYSLAKLILKMINDFEQ